MLPQNKFSEITNLAAYPKFGFALPMPIVDVFATHYGPQVLGVISAGYIARWWMVNQEGSEILIRASNVAGEWEDPLFLIKERGKIRDIALTFDQLGRPTVFYQVRDQLKLYWYDSQAGKQVLTNLTLGKYPRAVFDIPTMPSDPTSDMILFYVSPGNEIKYRYQRDRFRIEYGTNVQGNHLKIHTMGKDVRNRLQVEYSFRGEDTDDGLSDEAYSRPPNLPSKHDARYSILTGPTDIATVKANWIDVNYPIWDLVMDPDMGKVIRCREALSNRASGALVSKDAYEIPVGQTLHRFDLTIKFGETGRAHHCVMGGGGPGTLNTFLVGRGGTFSNGGGSPSGEIPDVTPDMMWLLGTEISNMPVNTWLTVTGIVDGPTIRVWVVDTVKKLTLYVDEIEYTLNSEELVRHMWIMGDPGEVPNDDVTSYYAPGYIIFKAD